jgi:hypothetical protein
MPMLKVQQETLYQRVHREAVAAPLQEIAALLQEVLSRQLTAYIAGTGNADEVARWASGEVPELHDPDAEQRLRTAYERVRILLVEESWDTVRVWFMGMNPYLDDDAPAEAARQDRLAEALDAAKSFFALG